MDADQTKMREQWLREEIRACRTLCHNQVQWGVTLLSVISINIYYIRRDIRTHLVENDQIVNNEMFPLARWLIGTAMLLFVAFIFSSFLDRTIKHLVNYRKQLRALDGGYSEISEPIEAGNNFILNHGSRLIFYAFPVFDLILWGFFYIGKAIAINFTW